MWHLTHSVWWTFSQNVSSLALTVWDWQCMEDIWTKGSIDQSINESQACLCNSPGYTGSVKYVIRHQHWQIGRNSMNVLGSLDKVLKVHSKPNPGNCKHACLSALWRCLLLQNTHQICGNSLRAQIEINLDGPWHPFKLVWETALCWPSQFDF